MSKIKIVITTLTTALLIILMYNISYADSYDYVDPAIVDKIKNNSDYTEWFSDERKQDCIDYVNKFKADDLGTNAIGQTLMIGNTTLKGSTELYCMEHNQDLPNIYSYTVTKYMEINGDELSIPGTSISRKDNSNIILAEILSRYENRYGEYKNYTKAQKALYMYLFTWLEWDPDQVKDENGIVINDGPQLSNRDYFGLQDIYSSDSFGENGVNWDETTKDGWTYVVPIIDEVREASLNGVLDQYNKKIKIYILEHKGAKRLQYLMIAIPEEVPKTELTINKVDEESGTELAKVSFIIKNDTIGKYISSYNNEIVGYSENKLDALEFTTGLSRYSSINIKGLTAGTYTITETRNPNEGYNNDYNIGQSWTIQIDEKESKTIQLENWKEEPEEENPGPGDGNVSVEGIVWEDGFYGKGNTIDSKKSSGEKGIEGVEVYWKNANGDVLANTTTDSSGYYRMEQNIRIYNHTYHYNTSQYRELNNSYIEFKYNGLKYTTVAATTSGSNTSKATESENSRKLLDNQFEEITKDEVKSNGTRRFGLSYTTGNNSSQLQQDITDFTVRANTKLTGVNSLLSRYAETETSRYCYDEYTHRVSCKKHGSHRCTHHYYDQEIDEWHIYNMNLGLVGREQPDLAIVSDINKVRVIMKGQEYTYKYNSRGIQSPNEELFDYTVKFTGKYTQEYRRPVNPSDIAYVNKHGTEDLQVYVTYDIRVKNQSTTLSARVQEIVNYYDANYTFNAGPWTSPSKYGDTYNGKYKAMYSQALSGQIIQPGQMSDIIQVEYRVNDNVIKRLLTEDALLKNISEIYAYSSFYGSNTMCAETETAQEKGWTGGRYAGIDQDSAPGNTVPGKGPNEDDTDIAPTFVLCKDPNYKIISGTVWEDTNTRTGERIGDGKYNSSTENSVEGVQVQLLKVNDDGTTEPAYLYYISGNRAERKLAVAYTKSDGHYQFGEDTTEGVVVDNYIIRYTYGNDKTTLVDVDKSPNTYSVDLQTKINNNIINARNYKSTVITEPIIKNMINGSNNSTMWHLTTNNNYSIAVDDLKERLRVQSLKYSNFDDPVNMSAYTRPFRVQIEYTKDQNSDVNIDGEKKNGKFDHDWTIFDFGIIERAREDIVVDKTISNLKITLANGQVLTEGNPYAEKMNYVKALGDKDIKTRADAVKAKEKFLYIEMDSESIQGARLDITYAITVTNNSEKDYEYEYEYNDIDENKCFITKNRNANYYYYGEQTTPLIISTVEWLVDYVDPELTCTVGDETNRDDVNGINKLTFTNDTTGVTTYRWEQVKPGTNADGTVKSPADILREQGLISEKTKEKLNKENYLIFKTNYFYNVTSGSSKTLNLFASKLLANQAEDYTYENHVEILQLNGKIARNIDSVNDGKQITKTYKPGDYLPSLKRTIDKDMTKNDIQNNIISLKNGATLHEQDDDMITIRITPPTGLENNTIIYIAVGAVALIVLAGGIYLIKKKVIG